MPLAMRQADGMSASLRTDTSKHKILYRKLQHLSLSAITTADETLKHMQHSIIEKQGGMFNQPTRFTNEGNYIKRVDYLL